MIIERFLQPWQVTLHSSIAVAMKARAAVRVSRLELDSAKQTCVRQAKLNILAPHGGTILQVKKRRSNKARAG